MSSSDASMVPRLCMMQVGAISVNLAAAFADVKLSSFTKALATSASVDPPTLPLNIPSSASALSTVATGLTSRHEATQWCRCVLTVYDAPQKRKLGRSEPFWLSMDFDSITTTMTSGRGTIDGGNGGGGGGGGAKNASLPVASSVVRRRVVEAVLPTPFDVIIPYVSDTFDLVATLPTDRSQRPTGGTKVKLPKMKSTRTGAWLALQACEWNPSSSVIDSSHGKHKQKGFSAAKTIGSPLAYAYVSFTQATYFPTIRTMSSLPVGGVPGSGGGGAAVVTFFQRRHHAFLYAVAGSTSSSSSSSPSSNLTSPKAGSTITTRDSKQHGGAVTGVGMGYLWTAVDAERQREWCHPVVLATQYYDGRDGLVHMHGDPPSSRQSSPSPSSSRSRSLNSSSGGGLMGTISSLVASHGLHHHHHEDPVATRSPTSNTTAAASSRSMTFTEKLKLKKRQIQAGIQASIDRFKQKRAQEKLDRQRHKLSSLPAGGGAGPAGGGTPSTPSLAALPPPSSSGQLRWGGAVLPDASFDVLSFDPFEGMDGEECTSMYLLESVRRDASCNRRTAASRGDDDDDVEEDTNSDDDDDEVVSVAIPVDGADAVAVRCRWSLDRPFTYASACTLLDCWLRCVFGPPGIGEPAATAMSGTSRGGTTATTQSSRSSTPMAHLVLACTTDRLVVTMMSALARYSCRLVAGNVTVYVAPFSRHGGLGANDDNNDDHESSSLRSVEDAPLGSGGGGIGLPPFPSRTLVQLPPASDSDSFTSSSQSGSITALASSKLSSMTPIVGGVAMPPVVTPDGTTTVSQTVLQYFCRQQTGAGGPTTVVVHSRVVTASPSPPSQPRCAISLNALQHPSLLRSHYDAFIRTRMAWRTVRMGKIVVTLGPPSTLTSLSSPSWTVTSTSSAPTSSASANAASSSGSSKDAVGVGLSSFDAMTKDVSRSFLHGVDVYSVSPSGRFEVSYDYLSSSAGGGGAGQNNSSSNKPTTSSSSSRSGSPSGSQVVALSLTGPGWKHSTLSKPAHHIAVLRFPVPELPFDATASVPIASVACAGHYRGGGGRRSRGSSMLGLRPPASQTPPPVNEASVSSFAGPGGAANSSAGNSPLGRSGNRESYTASLNRRDGSGGGGSKPGLHPLSQYPLGQAPLRLWTSRHPDRGLLLEPPSTSMLSSVLQSSQYGRVVKSISVAVGGTCQVVIVVDGEQWQVSADNDGAAVMTITITEDAMNGLHGVRFVAE